MTFCKSTTNAIIYLTNENAFWWASVNERWMNQSWMLTRCGSYEV